MINTINEWLTALILRLVPNAWQPNHITSARLLLIPAVWALYYAVNPWAGAAMFALVAATDFIDGRLARGRNAVSKTGKLLDIGCDLALVWTTVALLWYQNIIVVQQDSLLFWLLVFIFMREALITPIRLFFKAEASEVQVLKMGKCKTAFFMLGLMVLLTSQVWPNGAVIGTELLVLAAICSFISGVQYVQQFSLPKKKV